MLPRETRLGTSPQILVRRDFLICVVFTLFWAVSGESVGQSESRHLALEQSLAQAHELRLSGQSEAAIASIKRSMSQFPQAQNLRIAHASLLLELNRLDEAEKELIPIVGESLPNNQALLIMGFVLAAKGQNERSMEQFHQVLKIAVRSDEKVSAHLGIASAYEALRDQRRADSHYAEALAIEPQLRSVLIDVQKQMLISNSTIGQSKESAKERMQNDRVRNIEAELLKIQQKSKTP